MILENIALFDMDGTLCDYDKALNDSLAKLKSPFEPDFKGVVRDNASDYLKERANLIKKDQDWWANLPKFKLGWDILDIARDLDYRVMILTQGPRQNPNSWAGKKIWINNNLGPETDITITRDKSLVYGRVLVDDFPDYISRWLQWRKNGLVIMPASPENINFKHPQVIRYDGKNSNQIREAMEKAKHKED